MDSITVLVIDADESNRNFLAQLLQKKNYIVKQAASGEAGIRLAEAAAPGIVIFDTKLPDMKSTDLLERLQRDPVFSHVPCVALTNRSDPAEMQACLQAGCVEYHVRSGMVMMTLVDSIPRLLADRRRLRKRRDKGSLIVFLSAKGGTGTSSLCANIAMNMAGQIAQARIAVADLVLPMGSIASLVGVTDSELNLVRVAQEPEEKITKEYLGKNLIIPAHWLFHLLPGAPDPESSFHLQVAHIPHIVDGLRQAYDSVLIDLGRSLSKISMPIIHDAELVVLILSTDSSTVNHTKKVLHYIQEQGIDANRVFPLLNRAVGLEGLTKAEVERILGLEIKLTMPYMMGNFTLANNQNLPISVKFPTDTATLILKQAAMDVSQKIVKMAA